jgi:Fe-S cluster assembly protein SufD
VFQGRIVVEPGAQKTDGHQLNRTILLSDGAEIDTKPMLEIYADDVKCSHGCTIGRMDEQAVFYLRSRGVSEAEARRMMSHAFMTNVLDRIANADWRKHLEGMIDAKLEEI